MIAQFVFSSAADYESALRVRRFIRKRQKLPAASLTTWTMPANGNVRAVFAVRKRKFRFREVFISVSSAKSLADETVCLMEIIREA